MRHIRELGSLPADASEFASLRRAELMDRLHQTNESLKQYTHVNKKAYAQYNTFTEQRESLLQRQGELDTAASKIQELIDTLDQQKDVAIERTFKHVALNFKQLFKKLVPHGTASLVMRRQADADSDDEADHLSEEEQKDQEEEDQWADADLHETDENVDSVQQASSRARRDKCKQPAKRAGGKRKRGKQTTKKDACTSASSASSSSSHIQQYTGIAIRVSFSGKANETFLLQQLSGGQKSLVALALIFAIQQCDPAPFYLFDEIDAALDPAHRTAVANMIREQSQTTQFIYASFGKELVAIADQCYGITFRNKVSSINLLPSTVVAQQMVAQIHPTAGGGIDKDLDA
jgi:structural maintenance of chromosome 3 (chondroitin sulfate proteoglycan 6)